MLLRRSELRGLVVLAMLCASASVFAEANPAAQAAAPTGETPALSASDEAAARPVADVAMALDGRASIAGPLQNQEVRGVVPVAGTVTGADLLRRHAQLEPVIVEGGVYYQDIHKGEGRTPERGQIVYFMVKAYAANGGELKIGDTNHSHPEGTSSVHSHAEVGYRARWIFYGDGGGSFSLGTEAMDHLFSRAIAGMQEMGTRLIYIPAAQAYGAAGYEGHEFKVLSDTDLVFRVSLVRVVDIVREEELGLK